MKNSKKPAGLALIGTHPAQSEGSWIAKQAELSSAVRDLHVRDKYFIHAYRNGTDFLIDVFAAVDEDLLIWFLLRHI